MKGAPRGLSTSSNKLFWAIAMAEQHCLITAWGKLWGLQSPCPEKFYRLLFTGFTRFLAIPVGVMDNLYPKRTVGHFFSVGREHLYSVIHTILLPSLCHRYLKDRYPFALQNILPPVCLTAMRCKLWSGKASLVQEIRISVIDYVVIPAKCRGKFPPQISKREMGQD